MGLFILEPFCPQMFGDEVGDVEVDLGVGFASLKQSKSYLLTYLPTYLLTYLLTLLT